MLKAIFPAGVYEFFIIGGAMFALTTTLNATLGWVTKPLLQAAKDGWIPKIFGYVHHKYKTPMVLLTVFYVMGMVPILFNVSLSQVTALAQIVAKFFTAVLSLSIIWIPKGCSRDMGKIKNALFNRSIMGMCTNWCF